MRKISTPRYTQILESNYELKVKGGMTNIRIFTIGHSIHTIEDFLDLLKHYQITQVIDIRTIAKSRHNPQYNGQELANFLRTHHIGYRHQKNLGGLRHTTKESVNTAWRNASFRGFADYMQTPEFNEGIQQLIATAQEKNVAIMCSEAVPWRCHRSLVADALLVRNVAVNNIISKTSCKPHILTPWAHIDNTTITYPGDSQK